MKEEEDPRTKELLKELQSPLETPLGEQIKARPQRRQRRKTIKIDTDTNNNNNTTESSSLSPLFNSSPTLSQSELVEDDSSKGQLSMDENGQVRYLGKSSGFYLLQNSRTYQNGAFHLSGYCNTSKGNNNNVKHTTTTTKYTNVAVNPLELPPKDLSEHLVLLYLTHFYPVLPMFYKKRLVCSLSPLEPISPLLLNAIYAIASRVSPDERVRSDPNSPDTAGDIFFERAKCLLDDYYDTPRISTVQALLLMASHQMGAMKAARAWLYSGMVNSYKQIIFIYIAY